MCYFNYADLNKNTYTYFIYLFMQGVLCGMLVSLGVMTWIVTGAQVSIYNNELKFVEKNVSIAGCPANTTFKNHTDFSG